MSKIDARSAWHAGLIQFVRLRNAFINELVGTVYYKGTSLAVKKNVQSGLFLKEMHHEGPY